MNEFLRFLEDVPVVGILRDIPEGAEKDCAETAARCGLKSIEVTMNTPAATKIISQLRLASKPFGIRVGAGTVRTERDLDLALDAGAEFIVSPNVNRKVIEKCSAIGVPDIPGALSPTEVQNAYEWGATCVKIFPVGNVGGPAYIKALRGPFRDIPLLACGGVSAENVKDYILCGSDLVAFGASIFKPGLMRMGDWKSIGVSLLQFIENATAARKAESLRRRTG